MPNLTLLYLIPIILISLLCFILYRTHQFTNPSETIERVEDMDVNADLVADHLAKAIQVQTVSKDENATAPADRFYELHNRLHEMYPRVHANLKLEKVNQFSLLYTWQGSQPDLEPVLFAAHQDVVPADPASLAEWVYPPFSGQIADGFIWGRGSLDIKNQLIGVMEAVEKLLENQFQPDRTVYLAFGHDEEIGGFSGAREIVALLERRGVRLAAVLYEGGTIVKGVLPGIDAPVAMIGNTEKGYLTVELQVDCAPGHSSTPPRQTAIGILGKALYRLESNPLPMHPEAIKGLFQGMGKEAPFINRMAFANLWLFGWLVKKQLGARSTTAAAIGTTTAVTVVSGGLKDNILPRQARARVNFRILPGDTVAGVMQHVKNTIDDDRVKIMAIEGGGWEASPVSPLDTRAFAVLKTATRQTFGNIAVSPYLMLGATDSRHYTAICKHVYRYCPVTLTAEDLPRIHGINERISVKVMAQIVQFFGRVVIDWSSSETL